MSGFFYNIGRMVGPHVRKAKWGWASLTGTEEEEMAAEYEVGKELAAQIRQKLTIDPDNNELLNEIGSKLTSRVANKLWKFNFEAVQAGPPNAFALPGGFVFVTRSLLGLAKYNKDEIAFILGHEMSHAIRRHAIERIVSSSAINLGTKAIPAAGVIGSLINSVGIKFLQNAYSQDAEMEADSLGILLAEAAGFDGNAAIQMLIRLEKLKQPSNQFDIGAYFATHPQFELRIRNAKEVLLMK